MAKKQVIHKLYRNVGRSNKDLTICGKVVSEKNTTTKDDNVTCKACKKSNLYRRYERPPIRL